MVRKLLWLPVLLAAFVVVFIIENFLIAKLYAIVTPVGPPALGNAVFGNGTDGYLARWSQFYGQPAVVNSNFITEAANGVSGGAFQGVNPGSANSFIWSGPVGLGTSSPASSVVLTVNPLNASTTGQIINAATGATSDIDEYKVNTSTVGVVGPQGHVVFRNYAKAQIDALVPDYKFAYITCTNMTNLAGTANVPTLCIATGTAVAQFAVANSSGGVNANGCGTGQ